MKINVGIISQKRTKQAGLKDAAVLHFFPRHKATMFFFPRPRKNLSIKISIAVEDPANFSFPVSLPSEVNA